MEKHWKQHYTAVILQTNVSAIPNFDYLINFLLVVLLTPLYAPLFRLKIICNGSWLEQKCSSGKNQSVLQLVLLPRRRISSPLHISHPLLSRAGYVPQEALYYGTFLLSYYGMPPEAQTFNNVPNWIRNLEGNCIWSRGILVELKINILLHGWNEMNRCRLRLRCCWSNGRWRRRRAADTFSRNVEGTCHLSLTNECRLYSAWGGEIICWHRSERMGSKHVWPRVTEGINTHRERGRAFTAYLWLFRRFHRYHDCVVRCVIQYRWQCLKGGKMILG